MQRPDLVSALLEPSIYPHAPRSVELRETHISWVFLADDLAYKLKKPVVFPFLDYATAERRHEMCREEVRLNRRLAAPVYLGVVGFAKRPQGWALTDENDPCALEHAVKMRRVDESRSLPRLLERGELGTDAIAAVARRLARFHAEVPVAPPERRDLSVLVSTLQENLDTLREACGPTPMEGRVGAAEHYTHLFLAAHRDDLAARAQGGLVRDGHGDLRAEHVIVPEAGEVYVYDCVEFDPGLRQIDVGADLGFLVMDLTALGASEQAAALAAEYRRSGGDPGDERLLSFFASYRAWVRAKVALLRAAELPASDPDRRRLHSQAGELLDLGHSFAWRSRGPLALAVCGPTGSGKSTLARTLAELSGWRHLSSDLTRKRLAGLGPTERGGPEHYSAEFTRRTYERLGTDAAEVAEKGGGVIVDATFHRRAERDAFSSALRGAASVLFVECRASPQTLTSRVRTRDADPQRVSDAGPAVLERHLAEWEPLEEARQHRLELITEAPPERLVIEVERFLDDRVFA